MTRNFCISPGFGVSEEFEPLPKMDLDMVNFRYILGLGFEPHAPKYLWISNITFVHYGTASLNEHQTWIVDKMDGDN